MKATTPTFKVERMTRGQADPYAGRGSCYAKLRGIVFVVMVFVDGSYENYGWIYARKMDAVAVCDFANNNNFDSNEEVDGAYSVSAERWSKNPEFKGTI